MPMPEAIGFEQAAGHWGPRWFDVADVNFKKRRGEFFSFHTFIQTKIYQNVIKYHYSGTISCNSGSKVLLSVTCSQQFKSASDVCK